MIFCVCLKTAPHLKDLSQRNAMRGIKVLTEIVFSVFKPSHPCLLVREEGGRDESAITYVLVDLSVHEYSAFNAFKARGLAISSHSVLPPHFLPSIERL